MNNQPKKKVLVIGVGSTGERHVRCFQNTSRAEVSICEVNDSLRNTVGERYEIESQFQDLKTALENAYDAVVVAVPAHLHMPISQQAADAGTITVICEHGTARFEFHRHQWRWMSDGDWQESSKFEIDRDTLFIRQADAFLDAIEKQVEPLCSLDEGLQTLHVNRAALASVEQHQWKSITR